MFLDQLGPETVTSVSLPRCSSPPAGQQRTTAQCVLDTQSAASLAELRTEVHEDNAAGHSVFPCGRCEVPVLWRSFRRGLT